MTNQHHHVKTLSPINSLFLEMQATLFSMQEHANTAIISAYHGKDVQAFKETIRQAIEFGMECKDKNYKVATDRLACAFLTERSRESEKMLNKYK